MTLGLFSGAPSGKIAAMTYRGLRGGGGRAGGRAGGWVARRWVQQWSCGLRAWCVASVALRAPLPLLLIVSLGCACAPGAQGCGPAGEGGRQGAPPCPLPGQGLFLTPAMLRAVPHRNKNAAMQILPRRPRQSPCADVSVHHSQARVGQRHQRPAARSAHLRCAGAAPGRSASHARQAVLYGNFPSRLCLGAGGGRRARSRGGRR